MKRSMTLLLALLLTPPTLALAAPRVVVSITPIHGLVAAVMAGAGTPELLVDGGNSPHGYSLRPSQAQSLARADLVVWVGHELETFLLKPLTAAGRKGRALELMDAPGMRLLPVREGGAWDGHDHDHGEPDHGHGHDHGEQEMDPHLWLHPANARVIVRAAAAELAALDPANAALYAANREKTLARIDALEARLRDRLAPVTAVPYIVFHDAFQYYEQAFGTRAVGSITFDPERKPGAKRVAEIRQKVLSLQVRAVFAEPQFEPKLVDTLVAGTPARVGILDEVGADIPAGPEAWFVLMERLGQALETGLRP